MNQSYIKRQSRYIVSARAVGEWVGGVGIAADFTLSRDFATVIR